MTAPALRRHFATFLTLSAATQGEAALSFLGAALLVRRAGPGEAGAVFFAQAVAGVWFLLWDPRLEDAAQRFVPEAGARLFQRLWRADVAISAAAAAMAAALVWFAGARGWLGSGQPSLLILAILGGGTAAPVGTAHAALILTGRLRRLSALRLLAAAFGFTVTMSALFAGGPTAYLTAAALTALGTGALFAHQARRALTAASGSYAPAEHRTPPPGGRGWPAGIAGFCARCAAAASVAAAGERAVPVVAGALGGPELVTMLKVAGTLGRLFLSAVSPVATQLYPRMSAARDDPAAIRRDACRIAALIAAVGGVTVAATAPVAGALLALAYGSGYRDLGLAASLLLAAACVRATVVWSKTYSVVMGHAGARLAIAAMDGMLMLIALALAVVWLPGDAPRSEAAAFACGSLLVALITALTWTAVLRSMGRR